MRPLLLFLPPTAPAFAQTPPCPRDAAGLRADAVVNCVCTPEAAAQAGGIWGTEYHTADSHVCRAALRAGVVPVTGGQVEASPAEGPATHPGSMRNGVQTRDFGAFARSFSLVGPQATAPREPAQGPVAESLAAQGRVSPCIRFRTGSTDLEAAAAPVLEQPRTALAARITTDGRGQNEPIADNATDAGRAPNRRVEAIRQD